LQKENEYAMRLSLLSILVIALLLSHLRQPVAQAGAGNYRLAGVQTTGSPWKTDKSARGYELRICVTPTCFGVIQSASKRHQLEIGALGEASRFSAAELWVFYE
jgi:hypothetical protein